MAGSGPGREDQKVTLAWPLWLPNTTPARQSPLSSLHDLPLEKALPSGVSRGREGRSAHCRTHSPAGKKLNPIIPAGEAGG